MTLEDGCEAMDSMRHNNWDVRLADVSIEYTSTSTVTIMTGSSRGSV